MVRPARRDDLTDERSVRVSAGAPGSSLQAGGEIRLDEAECQKPCKEKGARKQTATISLDTPIVASRGKPFNLTNEDIYDLVEIP